MTLEGDVAREGFIEGNLESASTPPHTHVEAELFTEGRQSG